MSKSVFVQRLYLVPVVLLLALVACFAVNQASQPLTLPVVAPVSITTTSLPGDVEGAAYSATLTAAGGVLPYTWTVSSGVLPTGLTLSSAGVISGTVPIGTCSTGTCNYALVFTVTDSDTAPSSASIRVSPAPRPKVKSAPVVK